MRYKVTKVYLVDANDRLGVGRRIASEGEAYLKIVSIEELHDQGPNDPNSKPIQKSPEPSVFSIGR
jgi:hypothetical protein